MSKEGNAEARAYQALCEGQADAATLWLDGHDAGGVDAAPERRAWTTAMKACRAMTVGGPPPPPYEALETLSEMEAPTLDLPRRHALEWLSLAALTRFDREAMTRGPSLAERILAPDDPWRAVHEAEAALARGDPASAREIVARHVGVDDPDHPLGIRALCVRALAACGRGAVEEATACARAASRRARTIRYPAYRYLAGLCLAQARRRSGRPHLAVRILSALDPILPTPFRTWLTLEQMAVGQVVGRGDGEAHGSTPASPAEALVSGVGRLMRAAMDGDREGFEAASLVVAEGARYPPMAGFGLLPALLDPLAEGETAPDDAIPFLTGEDTTIPHGLELLAAGLDAAAWPVAVFHAPGQRPRRVMTAGLRLAAEEVALIPTSRLRQGRTDVAAAVLAMTSEPMSEADFFRATFRLELVPPLHEAALAMTLSRARKKLERVADVTRANGWVSLGALRPFAVPDPRCAPRPEGAVLRLVAQQGRITARGAARALGVSLRTVQSAVRQLVSDGELELDRAGRTISYRLDDTSFAPFRGAETET